MKNVVTNFALIMCATAFEVKDLEQVQLTLRKAEKVSCLPQRYDLEHITELKVVFLEKREPGVSTYFVKAKNRIWMFANFSGSQSLDNEAVREFLLGKPQEDLKLHSLLFSTEDQRSEVE